MKNAAIIFSVLISFGTTGLSSCASISEDSCKAQNWEALGYKDGTRGVRRDKVSSYSDRCAKFGITVDLVTYLKGFNEGLLTYCTYERGFALGEAGSRYNQVCSGSLAADFAPGYDEGRAVFEIYQEHESLVSRYENKLSDIDGVSERLANEILSDEDIKRLKKKLRRFKRAADDMRIDIRAFERIHDLPRYDP